MRATKSGDELRLAPSPHAYRRGRQDRAQQPAGHASGEDLGMERTGLAATLAARAGLP